LLRREQISDRSGRGHETDKAVILGLAGELPDTIDPDKADAIAAAVNSAATPEPVE